MSERQSGGWLLQEVEARFSEAVRRFRSDGLQHAAVPGRDDLPVLINHRSSAGFLPCE
jgi:hypothetical protein